jgi:hypothetical protein
MSGAWYSYVGTLLGQGKENARRFMRDSSAFDDRAFMRDTRNVAAGPKFPFSRAAAACRARSGQDRHRQSEAMDGRSTRTPAGR